MFLGKKLPEKKDKDEPWTGQVPVNTLMKVLSEKKKHRPHKKTIPKTERHYLPHTLSGSFHLFWKKQKNKAVHFLEKIYNFLCYYCLYSPLKHYSNIFFLFFLYFLLWHPGLDNHNVPKPSNVSYPKKNIPLRNAISPVESVYLEIDSSQSWLALFMGQKKIALYPVSGKSLSKGNYRVLQIREYNNGMVLALAGGQDIFQKEQRVLLKGSKAQIEAGIASYIELDEQYWITLHPYLRENSPVLIK